MLARPCPEPSEDLPRSCREAPQPSSERHPRWSRRLYNREREQLLTGRPDLDLGVHGRADAAIEARSPAAVLDLGLVERVLPVLPEPVLVQARVEVVPGQDLL